MFYGSLIGFGVGAQGGALTLTPQSSAQSASDLTAYTFATQGIGTASSDRIVIVAVNGVNVSSGTSLSSATIAGVSATILVQRTNNAAGVDNITAVIAAAVPTGTTGDVVLTFSTGQLKAAISTYSMTGGSITPHSTYTNTNGTDAVPDITINVPVGGGHVCVVMWFNGVGATTCTWGGTGITEYSDLSLEAGELHSSAYGNFAGGASSLNVTATISSGTITRQSMCGVSFSPA